MEIEIFKQNKKNLEDKIKKLLDEFVNEVGVCVVEIDYKQQFIEEINQNKIITSTKVVVNVMM